MGRFLSEDPISFAAGDVNLTRYVANSPVLFTDPSGLRLDDVTNQIDTAAPLDLSGIDSNLVPFMNEMMKNGAAAGGTDWLDDYAAKFQGTWAQGITEKAGDWIHWGVTSVISEEMLASASASALLAGTTIVSIPIGIGLFYGGSAAIGVAAPAIASLTAALGAQWAALGGMGVFIGTGTMLTADGMLVGVGITVTAQHIAVVGATATMTTAVLAMSGTPSGPGKGDYWNYTQMRGLLEQAERALGEAVNAGNNELISELDQIIARLKEAMKLYEDTFNLG